MGIGTHRSTSALVADAVSYFLAHKVGDAGWVDPDRSLGRFFEANQRLRELRRLMRLSRLRAEMPGASAAAVEERLHEELEAEQRLADGPYLRPVSAARLRRILGAAGRGRGTVLPTLPVRGTRGRR